MYGIHNCKPVEYFLHPALVEEVMYSPESSIMLNTISDNAAQDCGTF